MKQTDKAASWPGQRKVSRRADGLTWTRVDDDAFVLDSEGGFYLRLNASAAFIWDHLADPIAVEALIACACAAYDGDPQAVSTDVFDLLDLLNTQGVLVIED
jgi:hypothetical protein